MKTVSDCNKNMVSIVSNEKVAQVILQPANLLAVSSPTPESIRSSDIKVKIKQTPSMRDRQMKIIKEQMSLTNAPKMAFSLGKLRERHRKLIRKMKGSQLDQDFKNYEETDSDLYDDDTRPNINQEDINQCLNFNKKRRLEKMLKT